MLISECEICEAKLIGQPLSVRYCEKHRGSEPWHTPGYVFLSRVLLHFIERMYLETTLEQRRALKDAVEIVVERGKWERINFKLGIPNA